ncbi:carboxymuconolactone decarboxylase family protein [Streptomyces sp. NPDC029674]|uniref:carboxymuconolactone decarboxylase family protein n=1 Tax=Streptomyces sp. NPDC029674 TaxID=3365297 RepID=UPI00384EBCEE
MGPRLNVFASPSAGKALKHLSAVAKVISDTGLPDSTQELVRIRASQINGCGFCLDMHTKEAIAAGEAPTRLHLVAAWREATVFTEAERAALELVEEGTRIADGAGGVPDDVWANAAKHYDEEQLTGLVMSVALINSFNRLNVMVQQPAGEYEPGMFG